MDIGAGNLPSPFLGGVLNFCEPGDILTGLSGVRLAVPEVLAEPVTVLGLTMPKPGTVGGGVDIFPADSLILSSTSAKNLSSFSSAVILVTEEACLLDQGLETAESTPAEPLGGETEPGER